MKTITSDLTMPTVGDLMNPVSVGTMEMRTTGKAPITGNNSISKGFYVVDTMTGKPLREATVYNKTNGTGGVPGTDGFVTISGNVGDQIQVSYIGYTTQTYTLQNLGSQVSLNLKEEEIDPVIIDSKEQKAEVPWKWILGGVAGIFLLSALSSGGNTGRTGLNGAASKKKGKKKKSSKKKTSAKRKSTKRKTKKGLRGEVPTVTV